MSLGGEEKGEREREADRELPKIFYPDQDFRPKVYSSTRTEMNITINTGFTLVVTILYYCTKAIIDINYLI